MEFTVLKLVLLFSYFIKKFSILIFLLSLTKAKFDFFKYFDIRNIKYIPFSLSLLSYCGICVTVICKILMFQSDCSYLFLLGFIFSTWFIALPIKYSEQIALINTSYRLLFDRTYWITQWAILFSFLTYFEITFPLLTILSCKNFFMDMFITNFNYNSFYFNFFFLFGTIIIVYYLSNKYKSFSSVITISTFIMLFCLAYYVKPSKIISNIFIHKGTSIQKSLMSFFDGATMAYITSDIHTFLGLSIHRAINMQIKDFTFEKQKSVYATYAIIISILTTLVVFYIVTGTLENSMIGIFHQVDYNMDTNLLYKVFGYTYKVTVVISMLAILNILYNEMSLTLRILKLKGLIKYLILLLFMISQPLIALQLTVSEVSELGSTFYLIMQICACWLFIKKEYNENIKEKIQID